MSTLPAADPDQLLVAFLNTLDVEANTDALAAPSEWENWCAERTLRPGNLDTARLARQALRDLALCGNPGAALPKVALLPVLTPDGGLTLVPADGADDACGRVLAGATTLAIQGRLDRVKICPADDCRWAFYDQSRNGSRQWCSMAVCGNRSKTKAFRARVQGAQVDSAQ